MGAGREAPGPGGNARSPAEVPCLAAQGLVTRKRAVEPRVSWEQGRGGDTALDCQGRWESPLLAAAGPRVLPTTTKFSILLL